ncbi:MAG TPA: hypothetical protein VFB19_09495 [Mycobacterium sp.]|nr:hypothetical protein [Mycobacterium sp.]
MQDPIALAAAPRWHGQAGRLEVWYATLSDPLTRAGLWIHHETVAPIDGSPAHGHGWVTVFPADGSPCTERFGPAPVQPGTSGRWFSVAGVEAASEAFTGTAGSFGWEARWQNATPPLWTFPRAAWEREVLPGAQVVIAPSAEFTGAITTFGQRHSLDGWRGAVAHIYGHGNAKRWGWIHADLGDGDVVEVVTAVSHRPGLRRLPPMAFIRFRLDGRDWPKGLAPSVRMRTILDARHWQIAGRIGGRKVLIRVDQPEERCVSLRYTDPDGATAVCTNSEQADVYVELGDRRWSVLGTGHAEVGLRGEDAPAVNERLARS